VNEIDRLVGELSTALRGPRRARRRLLAEIDAHLRDAVSAEIARGADEEHAAAEVIERFGDVRQTAARWNGDRADRRGAARRNALVVALAAVAAAALGLTQYASGKTSPQTRRCAPASLHSGAAAGPHCPARLP
jgi:hypothetical protein